MLYTSNMIVKTYRYRIKDSNVRQHLLKLASAVNYVWNYCNETAEKSVKSSSKFLSKFDMNKLTAGCGAELGLHSQTVQAIGEEHTARRIKARRRKLRWRSYKTNLGWIPFKASGIQCMGNTVTYCKHKFRLWYSQPLIGRILSGNFAQDSRGRWYVNIQCEVPVAPPNNAVAVVAVDLGLKTQVTCSDGTKYSHQSITKQYAKTLATAQRAHKTKRALAIHTKIANARKDWNHKISTQLIDNHAAIYVGNVSSRRIGAKSKYLAKSVTDSSWYQLKSMLKYKAIARGVLYSEIDERFSTQRCSACGALTGPSGLSQCSIRQWDCTCGAHHDRDVNAARNILTTALGH